MNPQDASPSFLIMGVLNVTPDSFSDGGKFLEPKKAVDQSLSLLDAGASIIDVGAESTRPGSSPVSEDEELRRLLPVLERLIKIVSPSCISVDTRRPSIALKAGEMGVGYINNVDGMFDDEVMAALAKMNCNYIAMHKHGEPGSMQQAPLDRNSALYSVDRFVESSVSAFEKAGFPAGSRFIDPGIGFGKSDSANLALLGKLSQYAKLCRVAVGISRKSMIGRLLGIEAPEDRDGACKLVEFLLGVFGADIIRTHDVKTLAHIRKIYDSGS